MTTARGRHVLGALFLVWLLPVSSASAAGDSQAAKDSSRAEPLFWSFRPPVRPGLPEVSDRRLVRSPVDAFVLKALEDIGWSFSEEAERRTLARRVYQDLLGLPPTPEEVEAFVSDPDPLAYEKLVDRLLASPHYGERWGRHWLDVAGFAESSLFIGDQPRPDFWRYRDYVIRSFNSDKPYDEFVTEQLAGDELFDWRSADGFAPEQVDRLVATGFLRCPPDATDNQPITQEEKIYAAQQAAMEVSMKALMGLTLNCVRCHSHKYDPISHEEYYRLIAVFQPAYDPENWLAGIWSKGNPGPIRAIPLLPREDRDRYVERSGNWKGERRRLQRELRTELPTRWARLHLSDRLGEIEDPSRRDRIRQLLAKEDLSEEESKIVRDAAEEMGADAGALRGLYPEFAEAEKRVQEAVAAIGKEAEELPPLAWGLFNVSTGVSPTRLLERGDYESPGDIVAPGVLKALDDSSAPWVITERAGGRRLALARWLTNRRHPLTARVMVNRIWHYHFGRGLVATLDDFGARGGRPSHPGLLDWLAVEFMEQGWSVKHLHRLLLLSSAYRQSSADRPECRAGDPENRLLWRFSRKRLEAEAVRDSMLAVSGLLDRTLLGESVPTERVEGGAFRIAPTHPGRWRRSVYLSTRRTWMSTFLTTFDAPIMDTNCPERPGSAIPQQALAVMNGDFALECASHFAARVQAEGGSTFEDRLRFAWQWAYGRGPAEEEQDLARAFAESSKASGEPLEPWRTICHALLSSSELIYVD